MNSIYICHSKNLNNKIKRKQEKAFKMVYHDYYLSFKQLLERAFLTAYQKTLLELLGEVYKEKMCLSFNYE